MKYLVTLTALLGSTLLVTGAPVDTISDGSNPQIAPRNVVQPEDKLSFTYHPGKVGNSIKSKPKIQIHKRSADPKRTFRFKNPEEIKDYDNPGGVILPWSRL